VVVTSSTAEPLTSRPRGAARATHFHPLTVARVDRLTEDSVAVTFDVPEELRAAYAFCAGQSLTLRRVVAGVEQRRSYSICAAVGEPPRIGVREVPSGSFSRWLVREVRPGASIEVATPAGGLRADPSTGGRHLCIAAGSGITPLLSITASVLANPEAQVTLLYGNRTTASVMFAEELADLKNRYGPRLELVHVLSREPRDVELFTGRLDPDRLRRLLTTLVPLAAVDDVWLCGPFEMVTGAQQVLAELGVPPEKVHLELFFVDVPPPPLRHPDATVEGITSEVTVVLDGRVTTAVASRTTSVLEAAQQARSDLPFACKGGVCGTCRAKVAAGEVEMVRNYALEPAEVADDFVLTCQSFPVTERVTVDYDA
jgi:ring-1,2-phenylacetyl-CoA epoxidase subunit PaaE